MMRADVALTAAFSLAWKCGAVMIAISLIAAMFTGPRSKQDFDPLKSAQQEVFTSTPVSETSVRMRLESGSNESHYNLEDEHGNELVQVTYTQGGVVIVRLGKAYPFQPGFSITRGGNYKFAVMHHNVFYRLSFLENGTSGFTILAPPHGVARGFGFTKDGEFVDDPTIAQ